MWWLLLALACTGEPDPVPEPEPVAEPAPEPEPLPPASEDRYAATHVLIAWAGAVRAPAGVTRSEREAEELAGELHARAMAGEAIEALAREYSDGPSAPRGGSLGVYLRDTMVPDFEAAVASVEPGEIAPLVQTPFGWHVVRRDAVVQVRASHILVSHAEAWRSGATRTKVEARARVEEAAARIAAGEAFADVARELSDDSTAQVGGDLGPIARGVMMPAFEDALFALEVGEQSSVVETPYGYHLILRTE